MQALSLRIAGDGAEEWYASLVLDFVEGEELLIGVPMSRGREVAIRSGTPVILELALPGGLRRMTTRVRGRSLGGPPSISLDWPEDQERVQRRNDVRVDAMFPVEVRRILPAGVRAEPLRGLVADISAGGAQILLSSPLQVGETVELTMRLPGVGERQCSARVIREGLGIIRTASHPRWAGVMFTDLGPSLRREVTKLAFDIERERRRKTID